MTKKTIKATTGKKTGVKAATTGSKPAKATTYKRTGRKKYAV